MSLDAEFLEILRCPHCGGHFICLPDALVCMDSACRRRYLIYAEDIPNLLPQDAEKLDDEQWRSIVDNKTQNS